MAAFVTGLPTGRLTAVLATDPSTAGTYRLRFHLFGGSTVEHVIRLGSPDRAGPPQAQPSTTVSSVSSTVASGSGELAVRAWGDDGPAVVALHPGIGDSRIWDWCAPVWAAAGYRVVTHDRRGFGATRYVAEPHDPLADLVAVTAATGARPAVVVGNSRGGGLALDLALAHPDHVVGLVLIAPSPSGYPDDEWPETDAEAEQDRRIAQAEAAGDLALVNRLEVRYWLDGVEQPEGRVGEPARGLLAEMNRVALEAAPIGDEAERPPVWPALDRLTMPTLVIAGEHDLPGIGQLCADLSAALPNGRLITIDDTAHCPSLDQPEALNRAVIDFLDAHRS
ncbi:MAG: alpha/beta hydrolase [Acidimicrobiia bacterium]|nr:alpha/beta hydrolase [Acidimicrobiia bacterium]